MTARRMFLCGLNIFGCRVGVRTALEAGRICDSFYDIQERLAPYPHWYLMFIAVKPSQQGKGFGGRLLTSVLELMHKHRLPLYLETQCASNVEIYGNMGFRMLDASDVPGLNMKNYCMVKEAQS